MTQMHAYRSHTCAQLSAANVGETVRLSGWVHRKRDHGGVLFVDLRDHYGITQIVADSDSPALPVLESLRAESVVTIDGNVKKRSDATINPNLATGEIEVFATGVTVQSMAQELPMPVAGEAEYPEEIRLRYRFLDLRRETLHANIVKRWFHPPQVAAGVSIDTGKLNGRGKAIMAAKYSGLHALRHFYASWLINRPEDGGLGLPPKTVQERMGHSSIQVTLDVYSHLFPRGDDGSQMDRAASALLN